jgi:hypothetical protein
VEERRSDMKIRLICDVEVRKVIVAETEGGLRLFSILFREQGLILHSNYLGEMVGEVEVLEVIYPGQGCKIVHLLGGADAVVVARSELTYCPECGADWIYPLEEE